MAANVLIRAGRKYSKLTAYCTTTALTDSKKNENFFTNGRRDTAGVGFINIKEEGGASEPSAPRIAFACQLLAKSRSACRAGPAVPPV